MGATSHLVWHYTQQRGLLGILESGSIWATNIRFLNDGSEYDAALELLAHAARSVAMEREDLATAHYLEGLVHAFRSDAQHVVDDSKSMLALIGGLPYVACFSQRLDDLSQWRAYAPYGSGYAIGFERNELEQAARNNNASLERCTYPSIRDGEIVTDDPTIYTYLEGLRGAIVHYWQNKDDVHGLDDARALLQNLLRHDLSLHGIRGRVKDSAFADESEVRVTAQPVGREVLFRPGRSTLIPYIELPLLAAENRDIARVKEIIVGPTPNVQMAVHAVKVLCRKQGIEAIVRPSSVPYREP